jgi:uncharacterized protein YyaL (SSP411 family)
MPWGEEAFSRAAAEDKPILLSVGYAACHWCHVMAHESFEDTETAAVMNKHYISIKVDREERPDIDKIYMDALHRLGEQGGWPLTMFLKPDGTPFWGGTYFPPLSRYGRPGFRHVLTEIARIWREERDKVNLNSSAIVTALRSTPVPSSRVELTPAIFPEAAHALIAGTDMQQGGLRGAPKFPQVAIYDFLWRNYMQTGDPASRQAVEVTLRNICQGGIYDHLGGGFARYSVDHRWLVPHFEKMLYDNALLVSLLGRVAASPLHPLFRNRIEETVRWLLTEMRTSIGTFAASYDADSEGEEGRYYVWSYEEVAQTVPDDMRDLFCRTYDITPEGNWEGKNILNRLAAQELLSAEAEQRLAECRRLLLETRRRRSPPGFDDKSLTDWNGLAIAALAETGMFLDNPAWVQVAVEAFAALLSHHWRQGTLYHSYRNGKLRGAATADGYANTVMAALNLYSATGHINYLATARELTSAAIHHMWDSDNGGFFFAPHQVPELIVRPRFAHDDATPNANATMLANFIRLYHLTGEEHYRARTDSLIQAFGSLAQGNPFAYASFLAALHLFFNPLQAVIIGDPKGSSETELRRSVLRLPSAQTMIQYFAPDEELPYLHPAHGKKQLMDRPTLYLCRGTRCALPVTEAAETSAAFESIGGSRVH